MCKTWVQHKALIKKEGLIRREEEDRQSKGPDNSWANKASEIDQSRDLSKQPCCPSKSSHVHIPQIHLQSKDLKVTHFLSGSAKTSPNLLFTTKMVFPKSFFRGTDVKVNLIWQTPLMVRRFMAVPTPPPTCQASNISQDSAQVLRVGEMTGTTRKLWEALGEASKCPLPANLLGFISGRVR